jgi:hypothetical protein
MLLRELIEEKLLPLDELELLNELLELLELLTSEKLDWLERLDKLMELKLLDELKSYPSTNLEAPSQTLIKNTAVKADPSTRLFLEVVL